VNYVLGLKRVVVPNLKQQSLEFLFHVESLTSQFDEGQYPRFLQPFARVIHNISSLCVTWLHRRCESTSSGWTAHLARYLHR